MCELRPVERNRRNYDSVKMLNAQLAQMIYKNSPLHLEAPLVLAPCSFGPSVRSLALGRPYIGARVTSDF